MLASESVTDNVVGTTSLSPRITLLSPCSCIYLQTPFTILPLRLCSILLGILPPASSAPSLKHCSIIGLIRSFTGIQSSARHFFHYVFCQHRRRGVLLQGKGGQHAHAASFRILRLDSLLGVHSFCASCEERTEASRSSKFAEQDVVVGQSQNSMPCCTHHDPCLDECGCNDNLCRALATYLRISSSSHMQNNVKFHLPSLPFDICFSSIPMKATLKDASSSNDTGSIQAACH